MVIAPVVVLPGPGHGQITGSCHTIRNLVSIFYIKVWESPLRLLWSFRLVRASCCTPRDENPIPGYFQLSIGISLPGYCGKSRQALELTDVQKEGSQASPGVGGIDRTVGAAAQGGVPLSGELDPGREGNLFSCD